MNNPQQNSSSDNFADKVLTKLFTTLKESGVSDDKIEALAQQLSAVVIEHTIAAIIKEMDENDKKNWENFIKTKPNDAQTIEILDIFYKNKTGQSIEDLAEGIIINTVDNFTKQLTEHNDLASKISSLSDDDADKAIQLLKSGNFEEAEKIIKATNNNL